MNYPNAYKTDALYITKFEKDVKNSMSYQFIGAFPISIAATPVSYDQSDILKCTVSFSYMRYLRKRSGAGSERTGFMQRRLKADKSWYTPNYRSYKSVNAGPVNSQESSYNPWDSDLNSSIIGSDYNIGEIPSYDIDYNGKSDIDFTAGFNWNTKSNADIVMEDSFLPNIK